jgi:arylsulfatase A-like enzyme
MKEFNVTHRSMCIRTAILASWMVCVSLANLSVGDDRPNIVFIYADDHAQHAIGAYGSRINRTPNIDRLADEGMRFTQSFVANSICGPARATILTGAHSHRNGKMTNSGGFKDEMPTFAKRMQASGYQTAMVGKWHLGPNPNGFDHWAIARGGYYNLSLVTAEGPTKHTGYTTEIITDDALRWIEERDPERPFLVWISHTATHRTWEPPLRHLTRYDDEEIPEPPTLFDDYAGKSPGAAAAQMRVAKDLFPAYDLKLPVTGEGILDGSRSSKLKKLTPEQRAAWKAAYDPKNAAFAAADLEGDALVRWNYQRYIKDYLRCVDALDDSVGQVLTFLEERGLDENTIVIYSSDQGFFLGDHGWYDKRWMYEESLRTPLIVRWPGVTIPGSRCEQLVQNLDMAPTFLQVAGLPVPGSVQGANLVPLLRGETPDDWRDSIYYHYHQQDSGRTSHMVARHYGIRTQRHKLIHIYDHDAWELYDLEVDPFEIRNVYGEPGYAETVGELKGALGVLRVRYGDG